MAINRDTIDFIEGIIGVTGELSKRMQVGSNKNILDFLMNITAFLLAIPQDN